MNLFHAETITVAGESVVLMLPFPDWQQRVKTEYRMDTLLKTSPMGGEVRMPRRSDPLMYQDWAGWYEESDAAAIRGMVRSLGDKRVAVPVWPDAAPASEWGNRRHIAPVNVGWNEGLTGVTVTTNHSMPLGTDYVCPCMIGILRSPTFDLLGESSMTVHWVVEEDSSFWARVQLSGTASPGAFPFTPNWAGDVREVTQDHWDDVEYPGRERGRQGDGLVLLAQKAKFQLKGDTIPEFLAYWKAKRGSAYSFSGPSLFRPGADTPQSPHDFDNAESQGWIRFGNDRLRVEWPTQDMAEVAISLVQTISGTEKELPQAFYLIELTSNYGTDPIYATDRDSSASWGGHTWTPARFKVDNPQVSLRPQDEKIGVEMWLDDFEPLRLLAYGETAAMVNVEIYEAQDDGAVTASLVFQGKLTGGFQGKRFKGQARAFSGKLAHEFPSFHLSRTCNFNVYDAGCRRLRGASMGQSAWECTGSFYGWDAGANNLFLSAYTLASGLPGISQGAGSPSGGYGAKGWYYVDTNTGLVWFKHKATEWMIDDFFRGGWVVVGSGIARQVRGITGSHYWPTYSPAQIHLNLDRALRTEGISIGDTVTFYPGCNGKIGTCTHKFSNGENFGGFPYAPAWIEQKPQSFGGTGK